MRTYRGFAVSAILAAAVAGAPRLARAQADAAAAFGEGKTAFASGQFDKARELFAKASQTDVKNPEVFIWLGKADFELGKLNDALAAWSRTIELAPDEPYATHMLQALRGEGADADQVLHLAQVLFDGGSGEAAVATLDRLLGRSALSDEQRAKAMLLKADALVEIGRAKDAEPLVQEVLIKYPKLVDPASAEVLLARVKLATSNVGDDKTPAALAMLRKVIAAQPNSAPAARAEFELLAHELQANPTQQGADALAKWITAHGNDALAERARPRLIGALLALSNANGDPQVDAALDPADRSAIDVAGTLFKTADRHEISSAVAQQIVGHLDSRYAAHGAYAAAADGAAQLVKSPLPPVSLSLALHALARYQVALALDDVKRQMEGGHPVAAQPQRIADALATLATIDKQFPASPAWREQAEFAEHVRALGDSLPWPALITTAKPPYEWAVQIALPVVKAPDRAAVDQATRTVLAVVAECAKPTQPTSLAVALDISGRVLAALSPEQPAWIESQWQRASLLDRQASRQFAEHVKASRADLNAALSPPQLELIATLARIAGRDAGLSSTAIERLGAHLQPWIAGAYFSVARDAYLKLAASLPASQQTAAQFAALNLGVQQVMQADDRLTATGLAVPRKIPAELQATLKGLYTLQANLPDGDPVLAQIRAAVSGIVAHYEKLEYFDSAEQVINVKGDNPVASADVFAEFELARLRDNVARRSLDQSLKHFGAAETLTITPLLQASIDAYDKFIIAHPADLLAVSAAEGIFEIARTFEQHDAYDLAAEVYGTFVSFAQKNKVLLEAAPGQSSPADRAAFAAAAALDAKAREGLIKAAIARKSDQPPPAKLSNQSAAAIAAYNDFVASRPQSILVGSAVQRVMAIGLEYARADAWDVAESVYASLVAPGGVAVSDPERISFCRGMCEVGKVMPDHAKEVLAALTAGRFGGGGAHDPKEALATARELEQTTPPASTAPATQPTFAFGGAAPSEPAAPAVVTAAPAPVAPSGGPYPAASIAAMPPADDRSRADQEALAAISQQEARRAQLVASLRDGVALPSQNAQQQQAAGQQADQAANGQQKLAIAAPLPVTPPEELARQQAALDEAYKIFESVLATKPQSSAAIQARGEIMVAIGWWRGTGQWQRSADLARHFLIDHPTDEDLPRLRLGVAQDILAFASSPVAGKSGKQEMLAEVSSRFTTARSELARILTDFPKQDGLRQEAQWLIATSFLTQARVVDRFSPTLARGQYARAARELQRVAGEYADNPQIANVPQMLWSVAQELAARGYFEEAIAVSNDLAVDYPTDALAQPATLFVAQTYQASLGRPLRAAEIFLEINFSRGGNDVETQNRVLAIGVQLKEQKRWVEALHVLQTFVDSFPQHPSAGQALTMIGQIHQANEAWNDAIAAYRRVIIEHPAGGDWAQAAKWSIAECIINLSHWSEAIGAYETYVAGYPKDPKVAEATRRIGILKDLANYQKLVDEKGPKAFDAQFQMAGIIQKDLTDPYKAIVEYRKVATDWPKSHLADDALYAIGLIYLQLGEIDLGRLNLEQVARLYPDSPLADDALFAVGKSYEDEAAKLATLTRDVQLIANGDIAQKDAYRWANENRSAQRAGNDSKVQQLRKLGKKADAERQEASNAADNVAFDSANTYLAAQKAEQSVEVLTAAQLADRQDKINAAIRKAVAAYAAASQIPGADKAGEALLRVAVLQGERLNDPAAAMATWLEIVRQFSGTSVAEEASWRIAQNYEKSGKFTEAAEAYKGFLRNYRRSPRAQEAQFGIAENYEHLGQWVSAMDQYTNYITNFPEGPLAQKAHEQINFIKTYRL